MPRGDGPVDAARLLTGVGTSALRLGVLIGINLLACGLMFAATGWRLRERLTAGR